MIDALIEHAVALSTAAADRIYDGDAPQPPTYPYICVSKVSGVSGLVLEGADGAARDRFQFDMVGQNRAHKATVRAIARQLRNASPTGLHAFRGFMGSTQVLCVEFANELDLDEGEGDKHQPRITQDYIVTYLEA